MSGGSVCRESYAPDMWHFRPCGRPAPRFEVEGPPGVWRPVCGIHRRRLERRLENVRERGDVSGTAPEPARSGL